MRRHMREQHKFKDYNSDEVNAYLYNLGWCGAARQTDQRSGNQLLIKQSHIYPINDTPLMTHSSCLTRNVSHVTSRLTFVM